MQMEFARTGSVGVTHEPITSASRNVRLGMKAQTRRAETNQAQVMTGMRRTNRLSFCLQQYAFGSEMPVKRTWIAMTIRETWKDRASRLCWSLPTQRNGLKISAPTGPKAIPMSRATRGSAVLVSEEGAGCDALTHEHLLLEEEADETDDADVPANNGEHLGRL